MRVVQAPHPRSPYGVRSARSTRTCIMHRPTASSMQSLSGDTLVRATQAAHAFVDQPEWRRADRKAERVCEIAIDREYGPGYKRDALFEPARGYRGRSSRYGLRTPRPLDPRSSIVGTSCA